MLLPLPLLSDADTLKMMPHAIIADSHYYDAEDTLPLLLLLIRQPFGGC